MVNGGPCQDVAVPWDVLAPALVSPEGMGRDWATSTGLPGGTPGRWRGNMGCLRIYGFILSAGQDFQVQERDQSWGFDLTVCGISLLGNFIFCFQITFQMDNNNKTMTYTEEKGLPACPEQRPLRRGCVSALVSYR